MLDFGRRMAERGNTRFLSGEQGERIEKRAERTGDTDFTPPQPPDWDKLKLPRPPASRLLDEV